MGVPVFMTSRKTQKKKKDDWLCGYACALAGVARTLKSAEGNRIVREILEHDGIGLEELKSAVEAEDFDILSQNSR